MQSRLISNACEIARHFAGVWTQCIAKEAQNNTLVSLMRCWKRFSALLETILLRCYVARQGRDPCVQRQQWPCSRGRRRPFFGFGELCDWISRGGRLLPLLSCLFQMIRGLMQDGPIPNDQGSRRCVRASNDDVTHQADAAE